MISLVRIDERLIHGQVVVKWSVTAKATHIIAIDDEVAANSFLKNLNIRMAPKGMQVDVLSVDEGIEELKGKYSPESIRVILIVKTPGVLVRLVEGGIHLDKIIVGNMGGAAGRKQLFTHVHATEDEKEDFRKLNQHGVAMVFQQLPTDREQDIMSKL